MGTKLNYSKDELKPIGVIVEEELSEMTKKDWQKFRRVVNGLCVKEYRFLCDDLKQSFFANAITITPESYINDRLQFEANLRALVSICEYNDHLIYKKMFELIKRLPIKKQVEYCKEKKTELSEAINFYKATGIFEINGEFETRDSKQVEGFERILILYSVKLDDLLQDIRLLRVKKLKPTVVCKEMVIEKHILKQLNKLLEPYFHEHELLLRVLEGDAIDKQVQYKGNAREFVHLFSFLYEKKYVPQNRDVLAAWITKYFLSTSKGKAKSFNLNTVTRYLNSRQVNAPHKFSTFLNT
jgi:hypothetical protein